MNTAQKIVSKSEQPSSRCNWRSVCRTHTQFMGEDKSKNVVRFIDGSACAFTKSGKPVEFIG